MSEQDAQSDNGHWWHCYGCGIAWGLRITPRLFGLLERQGTRHGGKQRYRRFYGVVLGNFQCGVWGWKVGELLTEKP